jgi:thymidylate kinase
MTVVALEGLPGGGKTSLLEYFELLKSSNLITIGEHIFPNYLFDLNLKLNNDSASIYQLHWEAKDALCQLLPSHILIDRCYISCLAYNYAKTKMTNDPKPYQDALSWYSRAMRTEKLHTVGLCILLDVDPRISNQRKCRPDADPALWTNLQALSFTREFYCEVLPKILFAYGKWSAVNANRPFDAVLLDVQNVLKDEL